jgi:hypothetical protein
MTLPVLNVPNYSLTIPSTQRTVTYRPFLVKEEKLLLIAIEEDNPDAIFNACKQIIRNCTYDQVDIEKLKSYDLEYIILQLRIKSRGPEVSLSFKCLNEVDGKECGTPINTKVNLEEVKIVGDIKQSNRLMLTDNLGVVMKDPTVNDLSALRTIFTAEDINISAVYAMIPKFIDCIFELAENKTYTEFTPEEGIEFVESLTTEQFKKIQEFFVNLPKLKTTIDLGCPKCGHKDALELEGLQNFLE